MLRIFAATLACAYTLSAQTFTTTSISSSVSPAQAGQLVTLTATVAPAANGAVEFLDGFQILGTATMSGRTATLPIRFVTPKMYRIRAVYAGATNFSSSTSNRLNLQVISSPVVNLGTPVALPGSGQFIDLNSDGTPDIVTGNAAVSIASIPGVYGPLQSSAVLNVGAVADYN